ncbi:hypothetical protein K435DRAFT_813103 [Dendrothele bispora CBS 962.96]|uniref:Uncharacterized protein n=1 Tax=Dendrothele bispora (strain CBS 962.96) TaxID=1314807 RepID=A0A4S8KMN7_DENBC|nr:hypothetical protein K435DRAFT_813103 [Dendrothele bispora CBS 962.96]
MSPLNPRQWRRKSVKFRTGGDSKTDGRSASQCTSTVGMVRSELTGVYYNTIKSFGATRGWQQSCASSVFYSANKQLPYGRNTRNRGMKQQKGELDRDEGQMRPYPVEVASVTRAAKGNGSIEELQGGGDEQPEDKEKGKEEAEVVYPGEKGVRNYHADKESRLQKMKDLTQTWDVKEVDVKREKEKDSCRDRGETEITQRLQRYREGEEIHDDKKEICRERRGWEHFWVLNGNRDLGKKTRA